jgi:hypothetical protein
LFLNSQLYSNKDVIQLIKDIFCCQHKHNFLILTFKLNINDYTQLRCGSTLPARFSPRVQRPTHHIVSGKAADNEAVAEAEALKFATPPATSNLHSTPATTKIEPSKLDMPRAMPSTSPELVNPKGKQGCKPARRKAKLRKSQNTKIVVVGVSRAPQQQKPPHPPRDSSCRWVLALCSSSIFY